MGPPSRGPRSPRPAVGGIVRLRHSGARSDGAREAEQEGRLRDVQRLRRSAQPHASGFITALPSHHDGFDTILKPKTFRTAVYYRLGVPILEKEIECPMCKQNINVYGDHATCCSKAGDLIVRHNAMRNLVAAIAKEGLLSPILEKKGILGDAPGRRPGDVTIPQWSNGNSLALDIAVTKPRQCLEHHVEESLRGVRARPQTREVRQRLQGQREPRLRRHRVGDIRSGQQRGRRLPAPAHAIRVCATRLRAQRLLWPHMDPPLAACNARSPRRSTYAPPDRSAMTSR